jgi:hypothetical protein
MGNAYTAIADDASASFWNVGRLGFIRHDETMLEYRSVATSNLVSNAGVTSSGFTPNKPQLGFAGIVIPVTSHKDLLGSFGISYTEGGYFSADTDNVTTSITGGTSNTSNISSVKTVSNALTQTTVRNSFLTFAYGQQFLLSKPTSEKKPSKDKSAAGKAKPDIDTHGAANATKAEPSRLGVGIGVFFVNQGFYTNTTSTSTQFTTNSGGVTTSSGISTTPSIPANEVGTGVGETFGMAYDPANSPYSFGLSYRSKTNLSGLHNGQFFGNQTPDHLSLGMAYKPKIKAHAKLASSTDADTGASQPARDKGMETVVPLTFSAEAQVFSAVNLGTVSDSQLTEEDRRRAVSNLHFGAEYRPPVRGAGSTASLAQSDKEYYEYAFRLGFHTNANAATLYTYYDNVVSMGMAFQRLHRAKLTYSLEPAVEILTHSGLVQYPLTGRVSW